MIMRQAIEKLKAQLTRAEAKALVLEEAYSLERPLKAMGMAGAAMAYMLVVEELEGILETPEAGYRTVDEPDTGGEPLEAQAPYTSTTKRYVKRHLGVDLDAINNEHERLTARVKELEQMNADLKAPYTPLEGTQTGRMRSDRPCLHEYRAEDTGRCIDCGEVD